MVKCRNLSRRELISICNSEGIDTEKGMTKQELVQLCCKHPEKELHGDPAFYLSQKQIEEKCWYLTDDIIRLLQGIEKSTDREIAGSLDTQEKFTGQIFGEMRSFCPRGPQVIYHTHPGWYSQPSPNDLFNFLICDTTKTEVIIGNNELTVIQKPKNWVKPPIEQIPMGHEFDKILDPIRKQTEKATNPQIYQDKFYREMKKLFKIDIKTYKLPLLEGLRIKICK